VRAAIVAFGLAAEALLTACAGSNQEGPAPIGRTLDDEREAAEAKAGDETAGADPAAEAVPEDIVARAAAELSGYRTGDGQTLPFETTMTHLASADAICIGERHDDPGDHFAELRTIQALFDRRALRGFELGIGLEMVRQPYQPVLGSYVEGGVSEPALVDALHFDSEWGFSFAYYQPIFREALLRFGSLVAFGVPKDITSDVAEKGLDGINPNQRRSLPELDLEVPGHRAVFDSMMTLHPGMRFSGNERAEVMDRFYQAQVVWDESMAAQAATWLSQRYPGRKLVILAGAAHCHPSAIPARITRRAAFTVVSLLPRAKDEGPDPSRDLLVREYEYFLLRDKSAKSD